MFEPSADPGFVSNSGWLLHFAYVHREGPQSLNPKEGYPQERSTQRHGAEQATSGTNTMSLGLRKNRGWQGKVAGHYFKGWTRGMRVQTPNWCGSHILLHSGTAVDHSIMQESHRLPTSKNATPPASGCEYASRFRLECPPQCERVGGGSGGLQRQTAHGRRYSGIFHARIEKSNQPLTNSVISCLHMVPAPESPEGTGS